MSGILQNPGGALTLVLGIVLALLISIGLLLESHRCANERAWPEAFAALFFAGLVGCFCGLLVYIMIVLLLSGQL